MHLVLDFGPQCHHRSLHDDDQQPSLQPDHQGGNQIQRQRQYQGAADRDEVDALPGCDIHAGEQVGEVVVAAVPRGVDSLLLGQAGRQLPTDNTVEKQIGGMAEDAGSDHAEGNAADAE